MQQEIASGADHEYWVKPVTGEPRRIPVEKVKSIQMKISVIVFDTPLEATLRHLVTAHTSRKNDRFAGRSSFVVPEFVNPNAHSP